MANKFDANMGLWILDTADVIWPKPLWIKKIFLYPNAAGDYAVIRSYDLTATPKATMASKTVTVTLETTITSTGNFETAEVAADDIIYIYGSSTGNNKGVFPVATRSSDDAIIVGSTWDDTGPLTNEASKVYSWKIITPYVSIPILSPAVDKQQVEIDFGDKGICLPNFILTALSTSTKLYIYV